MLPQELIRAAAKVLQDKGWAQPPGGRNDHAFDHAGAPIPLWGNTRSGETVDTSRAQVNPNAAAYSIYGAIVAAKLGETVPAMGLVWDTLYRVGMERNGVATGGTNYVHPIIEFNNAEGRTKEEAIAFLEDVAKVIDGLTGVDTTVDTDMVAS